MDWILYAPQYHFVMGVIGLACLGFCWATFVKVRRMEIRLSYQAVRLLEQIAERGLWGATPEQVAARLVDEGLQRFTTPIQLGVAIDAPKGKSDVL